MDDAEDNEDLAFRIRELEALVSRLTGYRVCEQCGMWTAPDLIRYHTCLWCRLPDRNPGEQPAERRC